MLTLPVGFLGILRQLTLVVPHETISVVSGDTHRVTSFNGFIGRAMKRPLAWLAMRIVPCGTIRHTQVPAFAEWVLPTAVGHCTLEIDCRALFASS